MKRMSGVTLMAGALLLVAPSLMAQAASQSNVRGSGETVVPKLVRFNGALKSSQGKPLTGLVGVTFALYENEEGGAPLWIETQSVEADEAGHYTVLLGTTRGDGLPMEHFKSGAARWLGVQPEREPEQARVLLVSAPYALKAADAEMLGGVPASTILSALPRDASGHAISGGASATAASATPASASANAAPSTKAPTCTFTGGGTANFIPIWTGTCSQGNSLFFQAGGNVGLSTTKPQAKLDVQALASVATGIQGVTPSTAFF